MQINVKVEDQKKNSVSEEHGLSWMRDSDKDVLSIGISTEGSAEIRMAAGSKDRKIIATTIDKEGLEHTRALVKKKGLENQIFAKYENIKDKMPYPDCCFDYVYARLVLHYLDRREIDSSLKEIYRVLKKKGRLFAVVRSDKSSECLKGRYDKETSLTTYTLENPKREIKRYFHTISTITGHLKKAGFRVLHGEEHEERLFKGFRRKEPSDEINIVIEILAEK